MNFVIWQDLNRQRGPFTQEFSEVVEYVNSDIENGAMVSFHSPRVVRYLTNKNVFRKDKLVNFEHYEICEKILNSCTEGNKLFENDKFEIVFIQER